MAAVAAAQGVEARGFDDESPEPATAVVIGGGFIGVELTENLVHRGMQVALVEATPQVMAPSTPRWSPRCTGPCAPPASTSTSVGP